MEPVVLASLNLSGPVLGAHVPPTATTPTSVQSAAQLAAAPPETKTPNTVSAATALAEPDPSGTREVETAGTRVATNVSRMKTAVKEEQTAPWKVKELPVTGTVGASREAALLPPMSRLHLDRNGVLSLEIKAWEWMNSRPTPPTIEAPALPPETIQNTAAVERIERLILREVTAIRQLHADSLTVVLKPDARSEMVLQLQQRDGQLEAFVRCDSPSFDRFQRDWPQLQETLAQMNVRLLPLKENPTPDFQQQHGHRDTAPGFAQNDASSRQHAGGRRDSREETAAPAPTADPAETAPRRRGTRGRRTAVQGWETWA